MAVAVPFKVAEILVNTGSIERPPWCVGEVWNDYSDVALQGDHRVRLISRALPGVSPRMRMDVGENATPVLSAMLPQRA